MVLDLVSNYDLDGLLLDYFRYPVADSGYNQYAIERYNSEFGLSGQPAPDDAQFQQWRRRQLSDWLRVIYAEVMDVRPGLKLLAAVSQDGDHAFAAHYQDWTAWLAEKTLDGFLPMNYTTDNLVFAARSGAANLAKGDRHCYMGQGSYLNPKENTSVQLETARLEGSEGLATYSYRNTNNAGDSPAVFYQHLKDNVFTAPDPIPAMEWKDSLVSGIIFGGVSAAGGGEGRGGDIQRPGGGRRERLDRPDRLRGGVRPDRYRRGDLQPDRLRPWVSEPAGDERQPLRRGGGDGRFRAGAGVNAPADPGIDPGAHPLGDVHVHDVSHPLADFYAISDAGVEPLAHAPDHPHADGH